MKQLYDHIDTARQFDKGPATIVESAAKPSDQAETALEIARRAAAARTAKAEEKPEAKTMTAFPVPN